MCLDTFVAFKSGCLYSFILLMVLIARCVLSELSLSSEQCSPLMLFSNVQSDVQLRDQISNLSERVHDLQHDLFQAINHYGPIALDQCGEGVSYSQRTFESPICNIFNNLPDTVLERCPLNTVCDTQTMQQPVSSPTDFPWLRETSILCSHNTRIMQQPVSTPTDFPWLRETSILCSHNTREWQPIPHHIPALQTYHTMLVGNILQRSDQLRHDTLTNSISVMAATFSDVLCGMEITRQRLNHTPLEGEDDVSQQVTYEGLSLDLQNIVIMQSLRETLEHITHDLHCYNYMMPASGPIVEMKRGQNPFPVWLEQQRQARLRKKSWSKDNVIAKLLKNLRH